MERITYALNWIADFEEITETTITLSSQEAKALEKLVKIIQKTDDENEMQTAIFTVAKEHDIKPAKFFKTLYTILLGTPQGPRLGPYILTMGKQNVIEALKRAIANTKN